MWWSGGCPRYFHHYKKWNSSPLCRESCSALTQRLSRLPCWKAPLHFSPLRNTSELEMQLNEPLNEQFLAQNRIQLFQKPLRAPVVGVFFCALIVFSRFGADWAPGPTSWHTHSLTVRIKQQARCDANQNHLRLGACRSQAVPQLIYSDLDFTKIHCWGLLERGVHNIWRADNSNFFSVTKEMVISLSLLLLKSPKSWKTPRGGCFGVVFSVASTALTCLLLESPKWIFCTLLKTFWESLSRHNFQF